MKIDYYQKQKEKLQRKHVKDMEIFLKKKKEKSWKKVLEISKSF